MPVYKITIRAYYVIKEVMKMSNKKIGELFGNLIHDTHQDFKNSKAHYEKTSQDINDFKKNMRKNREKFTLIRNK